MYFSILIQIRFILEKVLTIKNDIATIRILYETSIECTDSNYAQEQSRDQLKRKKRNDLE